MVTHFDLASGQIIGDPVPTATGTESQRARAWAPPHAAPRLLTVTEAVAIERAAMQTPPGVIATTPLDVA